MAEDPDAIPSMQLAWEMIELARVIYKQREEVHFQNFFEKSPSTVASYLRLKIGNPLFRSVKLINDHSWKFEGIVQTHICSIAQTNP